MELVCSSHRQLIVIHCSVPGRGDAHVRDVHCRLFKGLFGGPRDVAPVEAAEEVDDEDLPFPISILDDTFLRGTSSCTSSCGCLALSSKYLPLLIH